MTSRQAARPAISILERGFLGDFAMQGGVKGLAEFDPAAGQRIKTLRGRPRAPHQQDFAFAENGRADGELGMGRLRRGGQGEIQSIRVKR